MLFWGRPGCGKPPVTSSATLLPDSYDLFLSEKAIVKLKSTTKELTYFLAVNKIAYTEKEAANVQE